MGAGLDWERTKKREGTMYFYSEGGVTELWVGRNERTFLDSPTILDSLKPSI